MSEGIFIVFQNRELRKWFLSTDSKQVVPDGYSYVGYSRHKYWEVNSIAVELNKKGFNRIANPDPDYEPAGPPVPEEVDLNQFYIAFVTPGTMHYFLGDSSQEVPAKYNFLVFPKADYDCPDAVVVKMEADGYELIPNPDPIHEYLDTGLLCPAIYTVQSEYDFYLTVSPAQSTKGSRRMVTNRESSLTASTLLKNLKDEGLAHIQNPNPDYEPAWSPFNN